MPGGDGTGPNGMGAMTGRAGGFCAGYSTAGYNNPVPGRGFFRFCRGFRRGGWGRRNRVFSWWPFTKKSTTNANIENIVNEMDPETELKMLNSQSKVLQNNIDAIKSRINELEKSYSKK